MRKFWMCSRDGLKTAGSVMLTALVDTVIAILELGGSWTVEIGGYDEDRDGICFLTSVYVSLE